MPFTVQETEIKEVLLITPRIYPDDRGEFLETYSQKEFATLGIPDAFVQDNMSISKQGTLRGLHYQEGEHAQAKLVSVSEGEVFDVAVDIRPNSPTFGKWTGVHLDALKHQMFYLPIGCAHGYYVLSERAVFMYKCSAYYDQASSRRIVWNDPTLHISWPLLPTPPLLSDLDAKAPSFGQIKSSLS